MKRFLINTLIFSLIIAVFLVTGEFAARRLPSPYRYKDQWLHAHGGAVKTLVLGHSQLYYGLRPELLGDSVFNLANISQSPHYDLALLEHYIDSLPNLRTVIMPVTYSTYRDVDLENDPLGWQLLVRYQIEMGVPLHGKLSKYNFLISDFDTYRSKLNNTVLHRASNTCDTLGFGLGYSLALRKFPYPAAGEWIAQSHTTPYMGRDTAVLQYQNSIIDLCRQHGVEPVFVTPPCWHTYRENIDTAQMAEMHRLFNTVRADKKVRYFDFFDDTRFGNEDFFDAAHLSDRGAAKFSAILRDSIF